jgi:peptidyl-prolyl cis-trans isomerase D
MSDKSRKPAVNTNRAAAKATKKTVKHWVAVAMFAAIIIVFALWGVNPSRFGADTGGVAATVNDASISLQEYRQRVENIEQNARSRFDQFPESQRKALSQELRRRALQELIMGEVIYQAAAHRGVVVPDAEVRDYILQIPFLQENGRFLRDRYQIFLQNMNMSSEDFERQIRKQLVSQKLQELFVGSAAPTREELKRNRELANQKVNIKYVEIKKDDLEKPGFVSDADVSDFLKNKTIEVEKYYKENVIEFTQPEKVHARHILIRVDEKRPDAEAAKQAAALKAQLTPKNFATLASKQSDDPGSKAKGGDLGEFQRGRMVPEFEKAAFELPVGKISDPIKTAFGYHIILVDSKSVAGQVPLEKAKPEIARKLLLRSKENEILAKTKTMVEKGDKKQIDALVQKAGLRWIESGEFDLSSQVIPKLGEAQDVVRALLKHGKNPGLVGHLISAQGRNFIVDLTSWKVTPDTTPNGATEGLERMVAYRKSSDLIEAWSKEVEAKATVQTNPRILQQ